MDDRYVGAISHKMQRRSYKPQSRMIVHPDVLGANPVGMASSHICSALGDTPFYNECTVVAIFF